MIDLTTTGAGMRDGLKHEIARIGGLEGKRRVGYRRIQEICIIEDLKTPLKEEENKNKCHKCVIKS